MNESTINPTRAQLIEELGAPLTSPLKVSSVLGVGSPKYVRDCCRRGDLPAAKLGGSWLVNTEKLLTKLGL